MARSTLDASSLESAHGLRGRTVGDAMLRSAQGPRVRCPVGDAVAFFQDDHVHAALVVDAEGRLLAVVVRADLAGRSPDEQLGPSDGSVGRTVGVGDGLEHAWLAMRGLGQRRRAVVDGPRPGGSWGCCA